MSEEREKAVNEFVVAFNEWKAKVDKVVKENNIEMVCFDYDDNSEYDYFEVVHLVAIYDEISNGNNLLEVINNLEDDDFEYSNSFLQKAIKDMSNTKYRIVRNNVMEIRVADNGEWTIIK